MKQGNGTEILGLDDPRAASIGIIHVSPTDDRKSVLAAIIAQEKFGRKQVAVVLPPLNQAFQRPADFDNLKSMRNRLQTEVVFIAPSGPGPGEFARQHRFPVYSSLQSYAQALGGEAPIENAPKKGWFGGPKPKVADTPPPTSPAPVVPPKELEDDFQFAPDSSVPSATSISLPSAISIQAKAIDTPNRGSSPDSGGGDLTPKQDRIMDEQTIYIGPQDDLTNVRGRLERIPTRRVTLVIPPQTLLRSLIAWRNLYARAQELGKEVLIISSDSPVRSVAQGAKFKVASQESGPARRSL